jgi:hypothetical protein
MINKLKTDLEILKDKYNEFEFHDSNIGIQKHFTVNFESLFLSFRWAYNKLRLEIRIFQASSEGNVKIMHKINLYRFITETNQWTDGSMKDNSITYEALVDSWIEKYLNKLNTNEGRSK